MPELMHICETCRWWDIEDSKRSAIFGAMVAPCSNPRSEMHGVYMLGFEDCPSHELHPEAAACI